MTATRSSPVVLLAGVPGAGKTETLREIKRRAPWLRVSDPEPVRDCLRRILPWVPYTVARPFVHTIAHIAAFCRILRRGGPPVVVHDPGTRRWSRLLISGLAHAAGRDAEAVFIDVDHEAALRGQERRGRVVRRPAFDRHWRRWIELRTRILAGEGLGSGEGWSRIALTTRDRAVDDVLALVFADGTGRL
ncbi:AAA family ATPase [Brevibacterium casei]